MILFPGISPKALMRILLPYIICLIVVAAVVISYIHFTEQLPAQVRLIEQNNAIHTANGIYSISGSEELSFALFDNFHLSGTEYYELKPEYLHSFNLMEFMLIRSMLEEGLEGIPSTEDSLALNALRTGLPVVQYSESEALNSFLIYYPLSDSFGTTTLVRMRIEDPVGRSIANEGRKSIYVVSVSVLILIILPGVFLMLADLRRKIEKNAFYQENDGLDDSVELINPEIYPSSFLDSSEFPALFRLNDDYEILYMNKPAEELIDISSGDVKGVKFHELPCFSPEDREQIHYPDAQQTTISDLGVIDSSDCSEKYSFRIEHLSNNEFAVSTRGFSPKARLESAALQSESGSAEPDESSRSLSNSDIHRIGILIDDCRLGVSNDSVLYNQLSAICDMLSGKEAKMDSEDSDKVCTIEISLELDAITAALNDVLPDRASIELDFPGFLPQVICSREDFTQIVKNMVFYSLESTNGPVRIKLGIRDVPSPVSDSIFSANCDRTVSRSVSLSFTDGTRIPVVLKEALLDPETDLSGIQRDYGSHISSVAAVLSRLDSHPVFTEGSTGTTLNILFRSSEDYLFEASHTESISRMNIERIKLALCDPSRAVRESVSDALASYGMDVVTEADLDRIRDRLAESQTDFLLLDHSALEEPAADTLSNLHLDYPDLRIILSLSSTSNGISETELSTTRTGILMKPYSIDELLNIIDMPVSSGPDIDVPRMESGE